MSIKNSKLSDFSQIFNVSSKNKSQYGEVITDFKLIRSMTKLIPIRKFTEPNRKWLDPCCGRGYFMIWLYQLLDEGLKDWQSDDNKRHNHIIENMLYMVEVNGDYISDLRKIFGNNANIYHEDFLGIERKGFDIIIGNPPFNIGGLVKVPTNSKIDKRGDGKTIWMHFVLKALDSLKGRGLLIMITPSIWMKRDHKMHKIFRQYYIKKLHTLNSNATNQIFHGNAQTPTCYFSLLKLKNLSINKLTVWDKLFKKYISFLPTSSIPLSAYSVMKKLQYQLNKLGPIEVKKTNMPHPSIDFLETPNNIYKFPNIKTCILKDRIKTQLVINYSNKECVFYNKPKLVLAHKMYGFPYYDSSGNYGISNRDNYVIYDRSDRDYKILKAYLSTKFALYLFEATRYRMKYLEKYIFEMIPDISKDPNVTFEEVNDQWLSDYFYLDDMERLAIEKHTTKKYITFI